jgi:hypothetical protein
VVCELKAAELDFPSSVPKTGLYRQGIQAVSNNLKSLVIKMPTRVVLTRVVPTRVVLPHVNMTSGYSSSNIISSAYTSRTIILQGGLVLAYLF